MYKILVDCPLFRGLSEKKIEKLIGKEYTINEYKDGDCIAQRDTAYSGLMIIIKGKVRGEITYTQGKKAKIEALQASQLIAPAFLFGGYNRLPLDVIAEGDVTIMTLHRGYIFELMQSEILIMSNFIDIISNRANVWSKKIYFLSLRSLKEKLATYLLEHTSESSPTTEMLTTTEITEFFDATRSAVDTALHELEKKSIISYDKADITVKNRTALADILK